jgi:hypothetical protein
VIFRDLLLLSDSIRRHPRNLEHCKTSVRGRKACQAGTFGLRRRDLQAKLATFINLGATARLPAPLSLIEKGLFRTLADNWQRSSNWEPPRGARNRVAKRLGGPAVAYGSAVNQRGGLPHSPPSRRRMLAWRPGIRTASPSGSKAQPSPQALRAPLDQQVEQNPLRHDAAIRRAAAHHPFAI